MRQKLILVVALAAALAQPAVACAQKLVFTGSVSRLRF
jgi:hypothetical protein